MAKIDPKRMRTVQLLPKDTLHCAQNLFAIASHHNNGHSRMRWSVSHNIDSIQKLSEGQTRIDDLDRRAIGSCPWRRRGKAVIDEHQQGPQAGD
jgi:hypothetical protein